MTRVLVIDGHPDPNRNHFIHACADASAEAASTRHEVKRIDISALEFPLLLECVVSVRFPPFPRLMISDDFAEHVDG